MRRLLSSSVAALVAAAACRSTEPVRIGVVQSSEGSAGARLAMTEINTTGGIRGRALSLRFMEAGGQTAAEAAIAAAESLSQDPTVIGVVGHANSSASLSSSQIYNARQLAHIAPTSSSPLLARAGPYTFRLVANDINQARFLADQVSRESGKPRTAVIYVNDDYGRGLYEELRKRLAAAGIPVVFEAPYVEGVPLANVDGLARAIANAQPSLLVWLGRPTQLRQLLGPLRPRVPQLRILGSDGLDNEETAQNAGGALTGVRYACFVDVGADRSSARSLRRRYLAQTGRRLTPEAALGYDATMLLATAARDAGPSRGDVHDYLVSLGNERPPYEGATGAIAFDSTRAPSASYCLAEVTEKGARIIMSSSR